MLLLCIVQVSVTKGVGGSIQPLDEYSNENNNHVRAGGIRISANASSVVQDIGTGHKIVDRCGCLCDPPVKIYQQRSRH